MALQCKTARALQEEPAGVNESTDKQPPLKCAVVCCCLLLVAGAAILPPLQGGRGARGRILMHRLEDTENEGVQMRRPGELGFVECRASCHRMLMRI